MYTSTVVISSLYLAEMAAVSAVSCCSKTMTCGCVVVFETKNYIGDLFIVAGVIWQAAAQSSLTLEESEADTDAAAVGYLLLLALCSSLLVVFSGALRRMPLPMWVGLVFLRTAAAALLVYTLLDGVAAPGGVQILMVSGAVVDGLLPWNNFPVQGES
jgi:hypothetical protein